MRDRLILLPGWAFSSAALEPLAELLRDREPRLQVDIAPLPTLDRPEAWLDELDARLPVDSWLAGWSLARQLQVSLLEQPQAVSAAGLRLLAELDGREALQGYVGPQLHLFADGDALVPSSAADALLACLPDVEVDVLANASHGLPLERADDVATAMLAFMGDGEDD